MLTEYRKVLPYLYPHWRSLLTVIAIGLVATLSGLAQPWLTRDLIDGALLRRDFDALLRVSVLLVLITVVGFVLNAASSYLYTKVSAQVLFDMRLALYRHLLLLPPSFFARTRTGEIVSRMNSDIGEVQRVSSDALFSILSNVIFLIGSTYLMVYLNARLFAVSVALLPISIWAVRRYQGRLAKHVETLRQKSADIGSFLIESLMGVRLIVSHVREEQQSVAFRGHNSGFVDALLRMQLTSYMAGAIPGTVLTLSTASVFLYGGKLVIDGELTIGGLMAFLAYHMRLLAPVQNLMGIYSSLVTGAVSLSRVAALFDTKPAVSDEGTRRLEHCQGALELRNVTFAYGEKQVLHHVNVQVPAGKVTVLLGPSGSGKTTIADLMIRLYDPVSGAVLLDGVDLREYRLADVRQHVAMVEQLPFLMHASIAENLRFAAPEASDEELRQAAADAQIDAFIERLPEGYATIAGERGLSVSAGERQRLALARTLLRNPSVLILDEPTSALDADTEAALVASVRRRLPEATILIITHRRDLAAIADHVLTPFG
ncbi:multidrug ABC transporter ATP-binding protein [Bryobacterales bacterium F-183]|nr:multidrug ABC transporter ATP-binding protein [Bryobacterales bacterium F-183]